MVSSHPLKDSYDLGSVLFFMFEMKTIEVPVLFSGERDLIHDVIKALAAINEDNRTKVEDLDLAQLRSVCEKHLNFVKNK